MTAKGINRSETNSGFSGSTKLVTALNLRRENYKFAGYERDPETQLDYAFARYYNNRLGRFMSVDPLGGSEMDPQSLNGYSFVVNNPTNFADPSGKKNIPRYGDLGGVLLNLSASLQAFLNSGTGLGAGWNEFYIMQIQIGTLYHFTGTLNYGDYNLDDLLGKAAQGEKDVSSSPIYGEFLLDPGFAQFGLGPQKIARIVNLGLHQTRLSGCLHNALQRGSSIILSNSNLPTVNTTMSQADLASLTRNPNTMATYQTRVPQNGSGTVLIASEEFNNPSSSDLYLAATYVHETGNILAVQIYNNAYHASPQNPAAFGGDTDTGAALEECVFGGYVNQNGSVSH